ncbi:MAG: SseB family protein [Nannocystaceae bacterium]
MESAPRQQALVDHLRALVEEGGDYNRLIVSHGEVYMQFSGRRGGDVLDCEAVTNRFLSAAAQLTPQRQAELTSRGYAGLRKRRNLVSKRRCDEAGALPALAAETLEILARAYGVDADAQLRFDLLLGDAEPTANVELLRAMKKLARLRDMPSRQGVYRGLLASDLLLILDPDGDDEPHVVEHLQGLPVYAAFTDWDALRLWEPRGWPYRVISGAQLFPLAEERRIASLMINPRGDIGGELLMNEIRGLAAAARRRRD